MKKQFLFASVLVLMMAFSFMLTGCDWTNNDDEDEDNQVPIQAYLSDYTLPENFTITYRIADTAIFNPGISWYFKTAKIGNDWQLIGYDRTLADLTKQPTQFYRYLSVDSYVHYSYDYTLENWVEVETVSFDGMFKANLNNFLFLNKSDRTDYSNVSSTNVSYDVDPTSNTNNIDATKYEFSSSIMEVEEIYEAQYPNVCLSYISRNGATVLLNNCAYEYVKDVTSWDGSDMAYRQYKTAPSI